MGIALYIILAAISQMEREMISSRVKAGVARARANGKIIGRKKIRPSEMIRILLKKGLKYREIASLLGISHGVITAEKRDMLAEEKVKVVEEPLKIERPKLTLV